MTPELTPQEIEQINREADKLYPPPHDEGEGFERYYQTMTRIRAYQRQAYAAALTSERLKHKAEIQAYREALELAEVEIKAMYKRVDIRHSNVLNLIEQTLNQFKEK